MCARNVTLVDRCIMRTDSFLLVSIFLHVIICVSKHMHFQYALSDGAVGFGRFEFQVCKNAKRPNTTAPLESAY
jgi:hypothetical protein